MKFKERAIKIFMVIFLVTILILSGCTTEKKPSGEKKIDDEDDEDTKIIITAPLFENFTATSYTNDSLWTEYNVHPSLKKAFYVSNSSVEEIVDWYFSSYRIDDWKIKTTGVEADPEDLNITSGHVRLEKNHTYGAYFLIKSIDEDIPLDSKSLIGIAEGDWIRVLDCGKET